MHASRSEPEKGPRPALDRRRLLAWCSAAGLSGTLFPGALAAAAREAERITPEIVAAAERIAGLSFTERERREAARGLNRLEADFKALRSLSMANGVLPALVFDPAPPGKDSPPPAPGEEPVKRGRQEKAGAAGSGKGGAAGDERPGDLEEAAFFPVTRLARLVRERKVTSVELTRMYLDRLERYDPLLRCVVTLTRERALEEADRADRELAAGRYRGPLHGIPWGAKDLFAAKGYPTTWGAAPFKDQVIDEDAAVVERLGRAGAVLAAKLSLGALAMGDRWFGGRTRNPWNPEQGSSGSSAGPACAAAAGLTGFTLGTETRGSIVSPCRRCGAAGLRPTFGRVSRYGAMCLSFSMDKVGPICRTVEDCALVFEAIQGPDPRDRATRDAPPFSWDPDRDPAGLRVGYSRKLLEGKPSGRRAREWREAHARALEVLRGLGVRLVPREWPDFPSGNLNFILVTEAAAAFDDLTRSRRDRLLTSNDWPALFRRHRFVPAVEYLRAQRARTRLMEEMARFFDGIDLYLGSRLGITNLTGHPEVVLRAGFREDGTPYGISFTGRLYGEADLLLVAHRFEEAVGAYRRHPRLPEPGGKEGKE